MVHLQRCLEEILVQRLLASEFIIRQHNQVRVPFGITRIFVFYRVQKHLKFKLHKIELVLIAVDSDFEILFTE